MLNVKKLEHDTKKYVAVNEEEQMANTEPWVVQKIQCS